MLLYKCFNLKPLNDDITSKALQIFVGPHSHVLTLCLLDIMWLDFSRLLLYFHTANNHRVQEVVKWGTITCSANNHLYTSLPPSTQISCVSSSTELANRVRFRYYFQLLPTEASIAPAYFGVIRYYGWKRVGLIVQNENLFTVVRRNTNKNMLELQYNVIFPTTTQSVCSQHRPCTIWSSCLTPSMSLTLKKHLRVKKTLVVLDLSHLWVIPEQWNLFKLQFIAFSHITLLTTGPQYQDLYHRNLCCTCKTSAVWGSPISIFLACIVPLHYTLTSLVSHPQAYQHGLRYPHHLLLTLGWYDHNWWLVEDRNFNCTAQERESVLPMSLSFLQFDFLHDRNLTTDTGIVRLLFVCFHSTLPHTLNKAMAAKSKMKMVRPFSYMWSTHKTFF